MSVNSSGAVEALDLIGPYQVIGELGFGSFSQVFEALDTRTGQRVALKVFTTHERGNGFVREAGLSLGLKHPNLLAALDLGYVKRRWRYVAYELASGGSLRNRMNDEPPPRAFVRHAIIEIARGLSAIHARKLVHRDLKPENVLLDDDSFYSRLRIADLGAAEVVRHEAAQGDFGSPAYMAPEQIRGSCDERADVYAFGVIAYELLCGVRPFLGGPEEVLRGHLHHEPKFDGFDPRVAAVLARALHKAPDARFQTAYQFAHGLENVLAEEDAISFDLKAAAANSTPAKADSIAHDTLSGWRAYRESNTVRVDGAEMPAQWRSLECSCEGEAAAAICASSPAWFALRDDKSLVIARGSQVVRREASLYGLPPLLALRRVAGDVVTVEGGAHPSLVVCDAEGQIIARSSLPAPLAALEVYATESGEHLVGVEMQRRHLFLFAAGKLNQRPVVIPVDNGIEKLSLTNRQFMIEAGDGQRHVLEDLLRTWQDRLGVVSLTPPTPD